MNTVRTDIAQVRETVNSMGVDVKMPNQYIYSKLFDVASLIIKREVDTRKIFDSSELFIPFCVPMKSVPTVSCTNLIIPGCDTLSRSVDKLPKTYQTPTGSIITGYNMNRSKQLTQTTPMKYMNIAKREFKGNQLYYWIENDYLYMPHKIDSVLVGGLFIDNSEVALRIDPTILCSSFLDAASSFPDWLRVDIIRLVAQDIAGVRLRIPSDEKPDENSNSKN